MTFIYPFIYEVQGDRRSFLPLGMKIREHYLKWIDTGDMQHVENAVPIISRLVGWSWKKIFSAREMDLDILDPVAYRVIFKFVKHELPTEFSIAHWLRVMVHRAIVRAAYKTYIPPVGDKSVRDFSYRPFMSPADIEHRIFVNEMKALLLEHIESSTRFEETKRKACRYLAEVLMEEKMPSPLILKNKFGIGYKDQQFYVDFTTVVLRNELYKLRDSLPHLYNTERTPFIAQFGGEEDEFEETWIAEEDSAVCDF